ncbi:MAG: threonylcarbamoyl-AMP synthase [Alphaproteobacteria bacterium]|nr:threonylcarbamoyl-AMP synthase [Alphaproteobacteria bacterium]
MTLSKQPMIFKDIDRAIHHLLNREVVALPTETVYGLAALGYDGQVVEHIYALKNRPKHNPLILHYARLEDSCNDVVWTPWAQYLAAACWPGPLTVVLSLAQNSRIPLAARGGLNSAAIRVPSHPMIQEILRALPGPLAAPSANLSGQLSPTTAAHVAKDLNVPILDGGPCMYGLESTIVDGRTWPIRILRPGALSVEDINTLLLGFPEPITVPDSGPMQDATVIAPPAPSTNVLCPGQLLAHYAPKKRLRLNATHIEDGEGLLAFGPPLLGATVCAQLSLEGNVTQAAARLFAALHQLDQSICQTIAVMPIPQTGLGCAINDRLWRACAALE